MRILELLFDLTPLSIFTQEIQHQPRCQVTWGRVTRQPSPRPHGKDGARQLEELSAQTKKEKRPPAHRRSTQMHFTSSSLNNSFFIFTELHSRAGSQAWVNSTLSF